MRCWTSLKIACVATAVIVMVVLAAMATPCCASSSSSASASATLNSTLLGPGSLEPLRHHRHRHVIRVQQLGDLVSGADGSTATGTAATAGTAQQQTGCVHADIDCAGHGRCGSSPSSTDVPSPTLTLTPTTPMCICDEEYATNKHDTSPRDIHCTYKRKKQLVALLLQIFLGNLGVARFYVGDIGIAVGQLLLGLGGIIFPCVALCAGAVSEGLCAIPFMILAIVSPLASFVWWIVDLVLFSNNSVHDGNGYGLAPI
jgi:TM2 domain-containing membrane protein YozV